MIKKFTKTFSFLLAMAALPAFAGNDTKRGQAGATDLLVNPWARTTGWAGSNTACIKGLESMNSNIAGLVYGPKTEAVFSTTKYLSGTGINISSLGFKRNLSETGAMGISVTSFSLGDFLETTYLQPDGTGNKFTPSIFNLALSYAKTFSNSISGGITVRAISQTVPNASTSGVSFDAGVQYQTGSRNQFHLGVAVRNLGPKLSYSGDGLTQRGTIEKGGTYGLSLSQLNQPFDMPTLLNIGTAYDFDLAENHELTVAGNFVSNSFTGDQFLAGTQYGFREIFYLRGGFDYSGGVFGSDNTNVNVGPTFGTSMHIPLGFSDNTPGEDGTPAPRKNKRSLSVDYSYRSTNPFNGTHSIGLTFAL